MEARSRSSRPIPELWRRGLNCGGRPSESETEPLSPGGGCYAPPRWAKAPPEWGSLLPRSSQNSYSTHSGEYASGRCARRLRVASWMLLPTRWRRTQVGNEEEAAVSLEAEENKAIVRRFEEELARGTLDVIDEPVPPNSGQ